jgi:sigma-B regulation protein RsbU (phosphoserine phosphatase)
VDDSAGEAEAIRGALVPTCDVRVFADGEVLIEALGQDAAPDVLVLDWELPSLSGIDVCQYLRGTPGTQAFPILMLTIHQGSEDVVKGLAAGANDYVFKPFRPAELAARVQALAQWDQQRKREVAEEQARRLQAEGSLSEVQPAEQRARNAEAELTQSLVREQRARREVEALAAALRESEERLRAALMAANLGTWRVDLKTGLETRDAGLNRILGLEARESTQPAEDRLSGLHPEDQPVIQAAIQRAILEDSVYEKECRILLPDGSVRWIHDRGHVLRDAHGQPVHFTGAAADITEQKHLAAETRQRAEFERQLIGIVSHDLRNPLSAITLTALFLKRQVADERQQRGIERIHMSAERANRMIRDVLDFTQARQGGGIPVQRKSVDLHELVRTVVDEMQAARPDRTIVLEQTGGGNGQWDPDRLAQVISNLLGNALQYSPADTPVRVSTRGEENAVLLEVQNTGAPISAELLPRIFEPLERGTSLVDNEGRSIGLGLYIVRHLVRAHDGTVNVLSNANEGTTFVVRLPRSALAERGQGVASGSP